MKTFDDYFNECMANHPSQTQTINQQVRDLDNDERCEACENWAKMKIQQDTATNTNGQ